MTLLLFFLLYFQACSPVLIQVIRLVCWIIYQSQLPLVQVGMSLVFLVQTSKHQIRMLVWEIFRVSETLRVSVL